MEVDTTPVLNGDLLSAMSSAAREVPLATPVLDYAVALVLATHPESTELERVRRFVRAGASPRGLQALVAAAQVRALLERRYNVSVDDVQELAAPTLRHRVLLTFEGQAEGVSTDDIVLAIIDSLPVP
jgi:MoxR-like ATPase